MKTLVSAGMPRVCWNAIAVGGVFISLALSIKIVRSSDVKVAVYNNRLEISNQALKVSDLLSQLEITTLKLQQQQEQYLKLKTEYDRLLAETNGQALKQLQPAIEEIQPTTNLEAIAVGLEVSKRELQEMLDRDQAN